MVRSGAFASAFDAFGMRFAGHEARKGSLLSCSFFDFSAFLKGSKGVRSTKNPDGSKFMSRFCCARFYARDRT